MREYIRGKYPLGFTFITLVILLFSTCRENKIYAWEENHIEYYINQEANPATVKAVKYGFEIWQKEIDKTFSYVGTNIAGLKKDGKNTISFLVKWPSSVPPHHIAYCRK
ncbi:MAG: hypothetical protein JEY91_12080, partial [Spirochaetaceae bacterium]|nr:hypothetical protein [Spirochaetaceae bacterium]